MSSTSPCQTYVLNTPVLTGYGDWRFEGPLTVAQTQQILADGFVSAVGHAGAAEFLEQVLGVGVPVQRIVVDMQPGDRAVVLRLKGRLPENKTLTGQEMRSLPFELGLLTRLG